MEGDAALLGGLNSVLFTVSGNVIFSLGENIFKNHVGQDTVELLFPPLISSLRSFSQLFEMDLGVIIAVGRDYIYKVVLSPLYLIEKRIQQEPGAASLAKRLGITERQPLSLEGFAIGFEVTKNPFLADFPEVLQGLELHIVRELAEAFFTEFNDQILAQNYDFDLATVRTLLGTHGRRQRHIVDVGHPLYRKGLDATIYYTRDKLSLDIHYEMANAEIQSDALARVVTTIYTSLNEMLGFANNPDDEGTLIIDFKGLETLGYSLFTFGKQFEEQNKEGLILSIMVGEKESYYLGGRSEIPDIVRELKDKTQKSVQKQSSPKDDHDKFVKWY